MTERSRCPECGGPTPADMLEKAREFDRNTPEGEHPNAEQFVDSYVTTLYRQRHQRRASKAWRQGGPSKAA